MTQHEKIISRIIRTRGFAGFLILIAMALLLSAYMQGNIPAVEGDHGLWFPSPNLWLDEVSLWGFIANMGLTLLVMTLMAWINSTFSLLRTHSVQFLGLFALMQAASPVTEINFTVSVLLALIVLLSMGILYSSYQEPRNTRVIFLVFAILTAGAMCQVAFVPYLAVMIVGCVQMRVFTLRVVLAAGIGVFTTLWIAWGLSLIDLGAMNLPIQMDTWIDKSSLSSAMLTVVATAAFTLLVGVFTGLSNLYTVYRYNARARALFGLFMLVSIVTGVMCIVDYDNLTAYLTLLNVCVSMQVGMFARIHSQQRTYVLVVLLVVIYIAISLWSQLLPAHIS